VPAVCYGSSKKCEQKSHFCETSRVNNLLLLHWITTHVAQRMKSQIVMHYLFPPKSQCVWRECVWCVMVRLFLWPQKPPIPGPPRYRLPAQKYTGSAMSFVQSVPVYKGRKDLKRRWASSADSLCCLHVCLYFLIP
jgi:hypothetical protein